MQDSKSGFVVGLVTEDGCCHDEQGSVSGIDISGSGNQFLLELGGDPVAVAHVLKVVGQRLKNNVTCKDSVIIKDDNVKSQTWNSPKSKLSNYFLNCNPKDSLEPFVFETIFINRQEQVLE